MRRGARPPSSGASYAPRTRAWFLVAAGALAPAVAMAQAPAASSVTSAPSAPSAAPASPDAVRTDSAAAAAPAKPITPATGYGWSVPKAAPAHARAARNKTNSPDALLPGFELLPDGSTRFFVELSKTVAYETKKGHGTITYVLKGAHVDRRNNYNPLVTVHFNTPVTSARLVPHGKDLWFVLELRADVAPTATMDKPAEGPPVLRITFPKGDYAPAAAAQPAGRLAPAGASSTAPPAQVGSPSPPPSEP